MVEICGWRVQEIFVDICEHAGSRLEGMVSCLKACIFVSVLMSSMTGEDSGNIEDNGCLFIGKRVLRSWLVCKGIEPGVTILLFSISST